MHEVNDGVREGVGMQEMATRLCGSADLFATDPGRGATSSINYVTAHDGFTLADLTQYSTKHNEANEHNNDGANINHCANFGVEGPCDDPHVAMLRERARMNMLGTLVLSLGTPMMLAGDEFNNSQGGNNNAYCQDNDITWLDWDWILPETKTPEYMRMESISRLIAVRKSLDIYNHEDFFTRLSQLGLLKPSSRIQWLLPDGTTPMERDWFDTSIRSFTMRLLSKDELDVAIVVNGGDKPLHFHMPPDAHWDVLWSSAETTGERPCPGMHEERFTVPLEKSFWVDRAMRRQCDADETFTQMMEHAQRNAAEQDGATVVSGAARSGRYVPKSTRAGASSWAMCATERKGTDLMALGLPRIEQAIRKNVADSATPSSPIDHVIEVARYGAPMAADGTEPHIWTFPALSISILLQRSKGDEG